MDDNKDIINYHNSIIASRGAMIVAIASFVMISIVMPFSLINVITGMYVVNVIFDTFFAEQIFGVKIKRAIDVYCVAFYVITVPIIWFETGGIQGAAALWMIFTVVYCIYGTYGLSQNIMLAMFFIEVIGVVVCTLRFPNLVKEISPDVNMLLCFFSLVAVGVYALAVSKLQTKKASKERIELVRIQSEQEKAIENSKILSDELHETIDKLEMANHTQISFNASMNHELRAPLNGIEGCLQILMLDERLPEDSKETIKNALTASKTINQTVNDLLDFAKLEEGKFEIVEKPFDLRDVLDNISTIFKPQANAKNLKLIIQIPVDTRVNLVADGVRIQQIMTNLISNGIKYTKEGSVTVNIKTERGHLKFSVSDTGQGMSEESLKVLFDPFTRFNLEQNANIQGTGLGMNIVSNMMKEMNGTISVESKIDEGTTFYVDIPIMFYDSAITYQSPRKETKLFEKDVDLSAYRVLCVDDTEINRTVIKGMLKNTGAKVTTLDCGSRAIKLCEKVDFDIVFLDHMMPEMDGIETLNEIRKLPNDRYKNVPIIMFTGNAGSEYKELYEKSGADGYLIKPIMYEDLIDTFRMIDAKKEIVSNENN